MAVAAAAIAWTAIGAMGAAPPSGEPLVPSARANPHAVLECGECHARIPEKGTTRPAEVLAGLRKDPVAVCRDCHRSAEVSHHPVVKRTDRKLPEGLPLSAEGDVICSTCHDVHLKTGIMYLLRGYDTGRYSVRIDMCLDCHAGSFEAINPHRAAAESQKCYTCHTGRPGAEAAESRIGVKENLGQVCDFCHNVSEKAHPSNADPIQKVPASLPRDKEGRVMCGTCHDPHGTGTTLHFLRPKYVEALEAGRYVDPHRKKDYSGCLGCHAEMAVQDTEMRRNLRYRGDDLQICLSCHGSMDSCHPILVRPGAEMKPGKDLPLSADGKIRCFTCHDPTPKGGSGVAMRGRKAGEAINAFCFRCHDPVELTGRNPHSAMTDRASCRFCHDTMTDPTNEEAARVSFISNTRLICLRCHPQEKHPMGVNHLVAPRMQIPKPFRLDGKGKLTCTTCHNPHIDIRQGMSQERKRRFVVEGGGSAICSLCHRR